MRTQHECRSRMGSLRLALIIGGLGGASLALAGGSDQPGDLMGPHCEPCGYVARVQQHNLADPSAGPVRLMYMPDATEPLRHVLTGLDPLSGLHLADVGRSQTPPFEVHVQYPDGRREIRLVDHPSRYPVGMPIAPPTLPVESELADLR
ncbi:MAG: hypothetical protein KDI51_13210 [Xanthomonadales bacterium]|nr:hypothetical protein [Xanthomonadales bacterium]